MTAWTVTLWGQPPSVNHLYLKRPSWMSDRSGRRYPGKVMDPKARKWQDDAVLLIKSAMPSHWSPPGRVRITYDFYLSHEADASNLLKVIDDAIQRATGVNDKEYLGWVRSKTTGMTPAQARVELTIEAL